jgi:signal peptidase
MTKLMHIVNKTARILYTFVVVALILIATLVAVSALNIPGGFKIYNVLSGSMEPTIHVGSIVISKPSEKYAPNDVITFKNAEDLRLNITHRVVETSESNGVTQYITKGDANNARDAVPVDHLLVRGKVLFSVPLLGYPISFAKTQTGFLLLIVIPATILIYGEVMNIKKEVGQLIKNKKFKGQDTPENERNNTSN